MVDDCPLSSRDGGFVRDGYRPELDALRELGHGGKQWIARYQAEQIERTGIPNLKVAFNKVFGYYLEVTNTHQGKVPDDYIRRQTVKNAERYVTPSLKEYEEKVLGADEKSKELEYELFLELRAEAAAARRRLQETAAVLAQIDVLAALAELARRRDYCRPDDRRGAGAADRRRPPSGRRGPRTARDLRAQRRGRRIRSRIFHHRGHRGHGAESGREGVGLFPVRTPSSFPTSVFSALSVVRSGSEQAELDEALFARNHVQNAQD